MLIGKKLAFMHYLAVFIFPIIYFNPIWGRSGYQSIIATYLILFIINILLTFCLKEVMIIAFKNQELEAKK
ncbi:MAG: hypothetical protein U5L76_00700 [Patescibacteria group bacterium]|nr:hypothetical protein [Patescibacteria group bacterium]